MLFTQFKVLTIVGIWYPPDWTSNWKKNFYKLYSFSINIIMLTLGLSQLSRLLFVKQTFKEFNDTFFILLSTNFTYFKATCHILIRKRIINLLKMFQENYCIPDNDDEKDIQKKYDDFSRIMTLALLTLVEVTAFSMIIAPFNNQSDHELIYKVLVPYDLSTPLNYWLTFIHHTLGAILFAAVAITNDALIAGFMLQVCSQLKLLEHRITNLPSHILKAREQNKSENIIRGLERELIKQNVQHHNHIFRLAKIVCMTFIEIVICQFFVSGFAICVSIYQISAGTSNKIELITFIFYLMCMLQQFFVYCYFGNEVTIQSKNFNDTVFGMDWTSLSIELKKNLTIILLRSSKPIQMLCGPFIHLTLESFKTIIKTSYSVFNVLQQSA
ncbi:PREDICTED: odorant receptor 2a-like [Ceratosolen solmsi marchali]|uniref:Odorant receptor n=1 Tax=Ceratosolen solmsi marchali TaxID=326594 RepID=A0AAJ6YUX3_9HYME|nr:PREDICTED: odorant receptor 2a-like [Ceratosolen solmsi marchali]